MHVSVNFQDERLDFELPEERVVATWSAPAGMDGTASELKRMRDALETPWDFPPLRQMIVPGDRVVIALDSSIAHARPILEVLGQTLRDAGVEPEGCDGTHACGWNGRAWMPRPSQRRVAGRS